MSEPSWNLGFPSLYETDLDNDICGNGLVTPPTGKTSFQRTSMLSANICLDDSSPGSSIGTPEGHFGNKQILALTNGSPISGAIPTSPASNTKMNYPKVFLPKRNCVFSDSNEIQCSVQVKIAKHRETYICMHDVVEYVSKKVAAQRSGIKWRHYDDRHFLFNLQDQITRDRFVASNHNVPIGDGLVKFEAWKRAVSEVKKPCIMKIWLRLRDLPIEYYEFSSVEFIVSSFGRLYKCNLEKKNLFVGCFYVMIDCPNIEAITLVVYVQTSDDAEFPVSVDKLYACPIDVYNIQKFPDTTPYDEIISALVERGKLIPLLGN